MARRKARIRLELGIGNVYSDTNLAGEMGQHAAQETLYLDILVCEDSIRHHMPMCRTPTDYKKFHNTFERAPLDAVEKKRGIPGDVRDSLHEILHIIQLHMQTRWGNTDPINVSRGAPQGSVNGPDASKPAQDTILRMRELGKQAYITSKGVPVKCSAYVDDAEHYGAGAAQLRPIMDDLSLGGAATGIGFAWNKFSAYENDWDEYCNAPAGVTDGMTKEGIAVTGYDIWQGGTIHETVPRAFANTEEKLLGKRGCIRDRHTIAREETIRTLANTRNHIRQKHASWDEVAAFAHMMVRGIIAYCPLVGIPHPSYLHNEDRALQRLLVNRMGIRNTAERGSLLAPREDRGIQITSVVESTIASVCFLCPGRVQWKVIGFPID